MIKEKEYKEKLRDTKTDALANVLGFEWDGSTYVKIAGHKENIVPTGTRVKIPAGLLPAVTATRRQSGRTIRPRWNTDIFARLVKLEVGEGTDISPEVRAVSNLPKIAYGRIYQYFYGKHMQNRYAVSRTGSTYVATRIV